MTRFTVADAIYFIRTDASREGIDSLDLDFLVGKEVPTHMASLGDGILVAGDGERYVSLRHDAAVVPMAILGLITTRNYILKNIPSIFLVCAVMGLCIAAVLVLAEAHQFARPLHGLARAPDAALCLAASPSHTAG